MPRILILTAGPLCRNPRVLKEATTLGNAGHEVVVLTIANIERFEAYDRELLRNAPFAKVIVDRVSRSPSVRVVALAERAITLLARRAVRHGFESAAALGSYHALKSASIRMTADLTIVHTEIPFCIAPSLVSRGRRVAADFEDWHSRDLLPEARSARPLRLLDQRERFLMQRSAHTSAPSMAMASALQVAFGGRLPVVIPNAFPLQPRPTPLPRSDPPSILWFSQTIGEGRGLEPFLASWAQTRAPSQVCLLGDISEAFRQALIHSLPAAFRQRLKFLPLTSPHELPSVIARHDIGLALEPLIPESRFLTTTNKIFQYLNAGLAVVATRTAGQVEVLSRIPEAGILVDLEDCGALPMRLDALLLDPAKLAAKGAAARKAAEELFSWEHCANRLLNAVTESLQAKGSPA